MACKCYCNVRSGWGFGYGDEELTIGVSVRTEFLQKAALLRTARILRKIPEA